PVRHRRPGGRCGAPALRGREDRRGPLVAAALRLLVDHPRRQTPAHSERRRPGAGRGDAGEVHGAGPRVGADGPGAGPPGAGRRPAVRPRRQTAGVLEPEEELTAKTRRARRKNKERKKRERGEEASLVRSGLRGRSTQYAVLSTQYSVPSTQYSVPGTRYSVLSTQYSALGT